MNLRLDGKAVAPRGWKSVCQPPESDYYFTLEGSVGKFWPSAGHRRMLPKTSFRTRQEMIAAAETFYGKYFTKNRTSQPHNGEAEDPGSSIAEQMRTHESGAITNNTFREPPEDPGFKYSVVSAVCWFGKISCSASYADKEICRKPALETWPKETCSELIYDAASGRFKPACAQHDPHLPESLRNERRCLSLCDAEGNCVIIRRTERGIELWQEKYKQRALIDPAPGQVLGMDQDNGTAKLKLTSLTEATLPANRQRTTIGVGEVVTVTTNQPVTWTISGSLVYKRQETSTSFTFMAQHEVGSILITAQTECEMQQLSFQVVEPNGINYELDSVNIHGSLVPRIYHKKGGYEFVVGLRMTLLPTSVNFGNLFFNEIDSASIDTGVFNDGKVHCHISGSQPRGSVCKEFHELRVHDENGKHNIIGAFDTVGGGENDPRKIKNLPDISEMRLRIETQWRVMTNLRRKTMGDTVEQIVRLHNNGQIYVMKGNFSMTVNKDDSFEDRRVIEDMIID